MSFRLTDARPPRTLRLALPAMAQLVPGALVAHARVVMHPPPDRRRDAVGVLLLGGLRGLADPARPGHRSEAKHGRSVAREPAPEPFFPGRRPSGELGADPTRGLVYRLGR